DDARRMGEPLRWLRPLLPEQADRRGYRRDRVYRRRLQIARWAELSLSRLCAASVEGEGLRSAHTAQRAPPQVVTADLRLSSGCGRQGPCVVASAGVRRSGDSTSCRYIS